MNLVVLVPTVATIVLMFAGGLLLRSAALGFGFGMLNLLNLAAISTLLGLALGRSVAEPSLLVGSLALALAVLVRVFRNKPSLDSLLLLRIFLLAATVPMSQVLSRHFGLSSVAFTDGHTILSLSQNLQLGTGDVLEGARSLKRGFALPALQSFGFPGEYLVGFMPLFFLAAVLVTFVFIQQLSQSRAAAYFSFAIILVIIVSTEAILRHLYLINTHSIAWLLAASFGILVVKFMGDKFDSSQFTYLFTILIAIGFLRVDYVLLFLPFMVSAILISAAASPMATFLLALAVGVPAWSWLTFATSDFPLFGSAGPSIILILGVAITGLLVLIQRKLSKPIDPLGGKLLYVFTGIFILATLAYADTVASMKAIIINLFAGEGLWGFTIAFLLLVYIMGLFLKPLKANKREFRSLGKLALASISVYVFTKYLDGVSAGLVFSTFARVGFGDSLNRTLITWIPFFILPIIRLSSALFPGSGSNFAGASGYQKLGTKKRN